MNFDSAGGVAKTIWIVIGVLILAIIMSTFVNNNEFTWTHMAAIGAMVISAFLSTVAMFGITSAAMEKFGMQQMQTNNRDSKQKNSGRKVREMLSRLSDEELEVLRESLQEESDSYGLTDDGELMQRRVK